MALAVRFILGRAGTGKTRHCVEAIVAHLADAPLGPPLFWIVPDQATFQAERLLATHPAARGSFRAQVTSFRRLAQMLAGELGLSHSQQLDELARIVLLGDLVGQHREQLELFKPVADRPGFVQRLDAMLRELQLAGHTGTSLRDLAGQLDGGGAEAIAGGLFEAPSDTVLPRKLRDLALLLDAWDQALLDRGFDSERLPQQVAAHLADSQLLHGARVWVDAFSALNLLEMQLLVALAQHAESVEITLALDPHSPAVRHATAPLDEGLLFHRVERTYRRLLAALRKAKVPIESPQSLDRQHRFPEKPALALIEQSLFPGIDRAMPLPNAAVAPGNELDLWECADPLTEVRAAAQEIRRLVTEQGLRYRDIGLIVPALEQYADPILRIFRQHKIPHFLDQRRSITHHPLVELLRSAVELVQKRFAVEDVCLVLKTGLTGLPDQDGHDLENYLLAHGITHVDLARPFTFLAPNQTEDDTYSPPTEQQKAHLARINQIRAALHDRLAKWMQATASPETGATFPGDALPRALYDLLVRLQVPAQVEQLIAAARAAPDPELVMIHEQAWRQIMALLETLERILLGRPTTLADFSRILSAALESLTLGLIPPTLDQVLISSVTRSRHPELQVVLILGALESRFPLVRPEDPVLSDHQRAAFNERTDRIIDAGSGRDLLEEQFFDYIAFTRASRRLIVSYPLADDKGKAVSQSQYCHRLRVLFPDLNPRRIDRDVLHGLDQLATLDDALTATVHWARGQLNALQATAPMLSAAPDDPHAALYYYLATSADPAIRESLGRVWPALAPSRPPALSRHLAAAFYPRDIRMSVSQLERFAACPLQYFFHYTLGLTERTLLRLDGLELGTLHHRILEHVFDRIIKDPLPWPDCPRETLRQILEAAVDRAIGELHRELAANTPEYPKLRTRITRALSIVLEAQRRAACQGDLRPAATELGFGRYARPNSLGANEKIALNYLTIRTPHGRTARLNGKIDRVDIAQHGEQTAVIDYKSSTEKTLDLALLYHGIQIQLPAYLLVIQTEGGVLARLRNRKELTPIAAFFVPLGQYRHAATDLSALLDPDSDEFFQQYPPRGLIDAAAFDHLDATVDGLEKRSSGWYKFKRTSPTKKPTKANPNPPPGPLSKIGNDALEHDDFTAVLAFTGHKIATLIDALIEGRIAPLPYRDRKDVPCEYCSFRAMCPFDRLRGTYRDLPRLTREQALLAMRQAVAQGGPANG